MKILVLGGLSESLVKFRGPLMTEMVSRGHEVIACAPNASDDILEKLDKIGVCYRHVTLERVGMNPFHDVAALYKLILLFRRYKPDIFLGYSIKPVIYGSIAAHVAGVSNIYTMIEGLGYAFMGRGVKGRAIGVLAGILYRIALRFSKKVFFLNPDNLEVFRNKRLVRENQIRMINGIGVELDKFTPAPYPHEPTFLMIGRFLVDKGIREYAEAARIVKKNYPGVRFFLVGWLDDGNPMSIHEQELKHWTGSGAVEYVGRLSDVRPIIAASSVYVLPSYHEGLPVTVMEAMAMGRAVITTDAPGCRETVQQGKNGFLVPVKDVQALAGTMVYFIHHPENINTMGAASREIAEQKFDIREINNLMLETMEIA